MRMIARGSVLAAVLLAASPAPALSEGNYTVRNGTGRALTCGLRQSGAVMILRESVMPSCLRAFAWFAQSDAEPYGATKSAVVAPAAVNGAVRSL